MSNPLIFSLNEEEHKKFKEWEIKQRKILKKNHPNFPGSYFTFEFTPTGIGCHIRVRNNATNKTIDITDYKSW
jgi:hypothetical protein